MNYKLFNIPAGKSLKKTAKKSVKKQINITTMRATNRRYYLHYRCKKLGIKLNKSEKQLSGNEDNLQRRWPLELRENYGYNLQIAII